MCVWVGVVSACKCATQCADLVLNADKTEQSDDVNGTGNGTGTGFVTLLVIVEVSFREGLEVSLSWPSAALCSTLPRQFLCAACLLVVLKVEKKKTKNVSQR